MSFFFSSRRRHTRYWRDWSSDVCSSDLAALSLFSTAGMEKMAPGSMAQAGVGRYTLEIEVDDVDAEFDRLNKLGWVVVKPPTTQPWGRRSVWVRDPDGN